MSRYNSLKNNDYTPSASSEIYALRREGHLDEARRRAEDLLHQDNTNQDVLKAYAWTLIDIFKREQHQGNNEGASLILRKLSDLHFNAYDEECDDFTRNIIKKRQELQLTMHPYFNQIQEAQNLSKNGNNDRAWAIFSQLHSDGHLPKECHESYGWTIYRYLKEHLTTLNSVDVRTQLRNYIYLENERPSSLHSQILHIALKYSKQDHHFKLVSFLRLWGPDNLGSSDFDDIKKDGADIPSLMSRIAQAVVDYPLDELQEFVELLPCRKNDFIAMLKEGYFWKLHRCVGEGVKESTWSLFEGYLHFFPDAPASSSHSKVLGLAIRIMKDNDACRFYNFFKQWNPQKLREDDWDEEKGKDGEVYPPIAIRSLKRVREAIESLSETQIGDLQWLIDLYNTAIEKFSDDDWLIRSKALLHLQIRQKEDAKNIYRTLCMKIGDKYYIWSEFAECCDETGVKIALLCKAISLEKNEDFIGKIRLELARQLITAKKYENAVFELERYKKHYTEKQWRVDAGLEDLLRQCSSVTSPKDKNESFYRENVQIAEDYAYADLPYIEMVLVDKWKNDKGKVMMTFVDGRAIEFKTDLIKFPSLGNSHCGQVWKFKLYKDQIVKTSPGKYWYDPPKRETITRYRPLILERSKASDWSSLPLKYGYIQYVNTEKKVYHIYSSDSNVRYGRFEKQTLERGDFITFRQYVKRVQDVDRIFVEDIKKCDESEALIQFKSRIVAVDDVNIEKQLFHFVLGPGKISGILHFDDTTLRPEIGDFIKIYYYVRTIEPKKGQMTKKKVIEVLRAEATNEINNSLIKEIEGVLELKYYSYEDDYGTEYVYEEPDYAFVEECCVPKEILDRYNVSSDCRVKAKAIYAGVDKWKKDKWKVYEISKV